MAACAASPAAAPAAAVADEEQPLFQLKELVVVERRKMPPHNFEGGVARVMKINDERGMPADDPPMPDASPDGVRTTGYTYTVKYVV